MKDKEQEIFNKYPRLFEETTWPMTQTCMYWGLECGEGWYPIIDELSAQLQALNIPELMYGQIKSKFGELRIYVDGPTDDFVHYLIRQAEKKANETCEICGSTEDVKKHGSWITVKCKRCREE